MTSKIITEFCELWSNDTDEFSHCKIILKDKEGPNYYQARLEGRRRKLSDAEIDQLDARLINPDHLWLPLQPDLTIASLPLSEDCYIKIQSCIDYEETRNFFPKDLLLKEARICEMLRHAPHPNIVEYHGVVVEVNVIKGLCLTRYDKTLSSVLRDGSMDLDIDTCLAGIHSGISHIHSLGLVHNDINPSNIMFRKNDTTPIIIDFDSCERQGAVPEAKIGTFGWNDGAADRAEYGNDLKALELIGTAFREANQRKSEVDYEQ